MNINENLKHLIEQCWSENPNDRPSFDEIYNKLANLDEEDDDNKLNYLLDDVDINDFNVYIEDITVITDLTEQLLSRIATIDKENQKLKNQISQIENDEYKNSIEKENQKLKENINLLETENKEQLNKYISIENENQKLKKDIKDLKSKNKKQISKNSSIEKVAIVYLRNKFLKSLDKLKD